MLLPYQIPSRDILVNALQKYPAALDASQTGTGKTYVALAVCKELSLTPAIVCPKSVIPSWKRVAHSFGVQPEFVLNYEALKTLKHPYLQAIGNGSVKKALLKWNLKPNTCLIFDEFHRCKGIGTINSRMAIAALDMRVKILMLSATVASNPLEMNALGALLNLHQQWNFWKWCRQNGCVNSYWGGLKYTGGADTLKKIHSKIFPERGTRIRISELGDQFPETLITAETYEIDEKKLAQIYAEMEKQLEDLHQRIKKGEHEDTAMVIMLRARQQAELLKVPTLFELASDGIEEGNSVAIFVNFNDTLWALSERFNRILRVKCGTIHGDQHPIERQSAIDDFQSGNSKIIVCNIQAGGVGISLHDTHGGSPRLSLLSPSYSAIDLTQCLGRVHRAGGKSKSIQKIVFAAGCVEEEACRAVQKKLNNLTTLNDGDLKSGIKFI